MPIIHNTTYDALRNVSPLLASRNGLSTGEDTLAVVADKLADLIATSFIVTLATTLGLVVL